MNTPPRKAANATFLSVMDAIHSRRSVRNYLPDKLDPRVLRSLLDAAVQAPTAMHEEPWGFVVIEDVRLLDRLAASARQWAELKAQGASSREARMVVDLLEQPGFSIFHNARTLVVIYSRFAGPFVVADCWLAAENFLLAACSKGLGTCIIGLIVPVLNTPEWRAELKVPAGATAIAPIVIGMPAAVTPPVSRQPPVILSWN